MEENKCLDQGTFLLHGGENEAGENIPFCSCRVSRTNRTYSMVTRSRHPPSIRIPSSLVSPVDAGTFPFDNKIAKNYSFKTKKFI